jgi:hypothetical protein
VRTRQPRIQQAPAAGCASGQRRSSSLAGDELDRPARGVAATTKSHNRWADLVRDVGRPRSSAQRLGAASGTAYPRTACGPSDEESRRSHWRLRSGTKAARLTERAQAFQRHRADNRSALALVESTLVNRPGVDTMRRSVCSPWQRRTRSLQRSRPATPRGTLMVGVTMALAVSHAEAVRRPKRPRPVTASRARILPRPLTPSLRLLLLRTRCRSSRSRCRPGAPRR